jgi:hypothetical protein
LELLELEPGVISSAEVEAESERAQLHLPLKQVRRTPVRQALPAHLPRIEQIIECTAEECVCGGCGGQKIESKRPMMLESKPATFLGLNWLKVFWMISSFFGGPAATCGLQKFP